MFKKFLIVGALGLALALLLSLWCVDALSALSHNGDEDRRFFRKGPRPLELASDGLAA